MFSFLEILILLLEFVGLSITIYIMVKNLKKQSPVCFIGHSCDFVLNSKYSKIFGIKVEVYGFFYYLSMILLFLAKYYVTEYASFIVILFTLGVSLAAITSVVLTYIQTRVLKSLCSWCLLAAFSNLLLFFTVLLYLSQ